ncbi:MAG: proline dehydrogenase family protein, partial [Acidobacteriota bacterium]|nr:proline dehydrogenase family protein [Acidobacteriota bacterium]
MRRQARRFTAGESLEAGISVTRSLNKNFVLTTLSYSGAHSRSECQALEASQEHCKALAKIRSEDLGADVSVKLTNIGLDIDTQFCRKQLHRILRQAQMVGGAVTIDMEEYVYLDRTLCLFKEAQERFGPGTVGITLQSYLRCGISVLSQLLSATSRIRLVRGGYQESEMCVFTKRAENHRAFRESVAALLDSQAPGGAVATHDERVIREAISRTNKPHCEFQLLYGVRSELALKLASDG